MIPSFGVISGVKTALRLNGFLGGVLAQTSSKEPLSCELIIKILSYYLRVFVT